ncbi:MAG: vitamin B12-dependent ribonucleotide reductase, partial [Planctomycetota bacterium]|nr:vitamin B12-dependent ribonucleotide reductase [Planctomycetota bacterium]
MPVQTPSRLSPSPEKAPASLTSEIGHTENHQNGWHIARHFTKSGIHPYDEIEWAERDACITNFKGEKVFEQQGIEVPEAWSENATNIVASKYFAGPKDSPERERSARQLIDRVVKTTRQWGEADGYFKTAEEADVFEHELTYILIHQMAAFNSPVWFNLGVDENPQVSACFINSVEDSMDSILELAKTEGILFKHGSGCGTNLSTIRSSKEMVVRGGKASGPVSFMKGYDAFSSVIKSGGKTRRAAKMQILNADHPDIIDFIECKRKEEKKAWALVDAGYDGDIDGEAYRSVFFQNSNLSVRVSDEFMQAVEEDGEWQTRAVTNREPVETFRARELFRKICDAAHGCGDPGVQFDDAMNNWNPCSDTTRINASNPCSEYVFVDDSACNLASLNLMKFRRPDGSFDTDGFAHGVKLLIAAQEIFVSRASYPTEKIASNSHRYRPLGLGYANLGALLMANGLPYDS